MLTIDDFKRLNNIKKIVDKLNAYTKGIVSIDFTGIYTDAYPADFQVFMKREAFFENFSDKCHEFHTYHFDDVTIVGVVIDKILYHCQVPNEEWKSGEGE